jgi:hypothetical protein
VGGRRCGAHSYCNECGLKINARKQLTRIQKAHVRQVDVMNNVNTSNHSSTDPMYYNRMGSSPHMSTKPMGTTPLQSTYVAEVPIPVSVTRPMSSNASPNIADSMDIPSMRAPEHGATSSHSPVVFSLSAPTTRPVEASHYNEYIELSENYRLKRFVQTANCSVTCPQPVYPFPSCCYMRDSVMNDSSDSGSASVFRSDHGSEHDMHDFSSSPSGRESRPNNNM